MVDKETLWQRLKGVPFPGFKDKSVLGVVKGAQIDEAGVVTLQLAIAHLGRSGREAVLGVIDEALTALPGVTMLRAEIVPMAPPAAPSAARPSIRHVIAVGSGKGGVGKSTVAVSVALGLVQEGLRVGLVDADLFGPNVPRMLGVGELPARRGALIEPAAAHGLRFVSLGLLVAPEQAVVWRGPMTDKLLRQFTQGVAWGELDVLVVDLPPGTGDIPLSLARYTEPDGAIVVVTPQEVALDDARKAIGMFRRLEIPLLGVVENMSYFECPDCGSRHALFGEGGGQRLAEEAGIPLLGQVPMGTEVRRGGDEGAPAVLDGGSLAGEALRAVARRVAQRLTEREAERA